MVGVAAINTGQTVGSTLAREVLVLMFSRDRDTRAHGRSRQRGRQRAFPGVRPREIGPAPGVPRARRPAGDRLDLLARHYYNDDRLWWRIVDANPEVLFGGDMLLGGHSRAAG